MDNLPIPVQKTPVQGFVKIPGSKSLTNRALIIAALCEGETKIKDYLLAEDTEAMIKCLQQLGVSIEINPRQLIVLGTGGKISPCKDKLFVSGAGTVARFLLPLLSLGEGDYFIDSNQRNRERPIDELLFGLKTLGCRIKKTNPPLSFPLKIKASGFKGGKITLESSISSQFISAIMLTAPLAAEDTYITLKGDTVSLSYIEMTRKVMEHFGVNCEWLTQDQLFIEANQKYISRDYTIEADASSASYFFAMAAITKGQITLAPFSPKSLQGDLGFLQILKNMGCQIKWGINEVTLIGKELHAVEVDMKDLSDVSLTLAVTALFATGKTCIKGIQNIRLKECDRLKALATELTKLGAKVEETKDSIAINGKGQYHGASIKTYNDHRMAMSFSLAGLKIPDLEIEDPACVQKTFPKYWEQFFETLEMNFHNHSSKTLKKLLPTS